MRNLATIQRIVNIRPIPDADKIEAIDVLGWTVVSSKGTHSIGDLVIYFEIDSWLDATDTRYASFEERFSNWGDRRGMRLKSIRLRKQLSQGLIMPIKEFTEIVNPVEGMDVTELLKVDKWESLSEQRQNQSSSSKSTTGQFPSFIRKTDQERVQNRIGELQGMKDQTFEVTVKLDGSSMTVFHVNNQSVQYADIIQEVNDRAMRRMTMWGKAWFKFKKLLGLDKDPEFMQGVCSRNIQLMPGDTDHFSQYAKDNNIIDKLQVLNRNIALQGELIGPNIQENYEKTACNEYYVYDIFDIDKQCYLLPEEAFMTTKSLGLNYVPILETQLKLSSFGDLDNSDPENLRSIVDKILTYAEGAGMKPGVKREGVVFKSTSTDKSMKAISNSYLLKKDK